jgi:ADP-ribose pyrophosphatase YjhB (NUDIX family)
MPEVVPPPFRFCPACAVPLVGPLTRQDLDCGACGFRYYQNVATGVAAFLTCATQVLVVRRAAEPARGTLDLPGGFVMAGESLEEALARELHEEIGLDALPDAPRYLFSLPNRYRYAGVEYATADAFFEIPVPSPFTAVGGDDAADPTWVEQRALVPSAFGLHSVSAAVARFRVARRSP